MLRVILLGIIGAICFAATLALETGDEKVSFDASEVNLRPHYALDTRNPRTNYVLHCSGCHLPDGAGVASSGIPDLRGNLAHFLKDPAGRAYLASIPGVAQAPLENDQLADVMNWMLEEFSAETLPEDFVAFTPDEIARLKADRRVDVASFRHEVTGRLSASSDLKFDRVYEPVRRSIIQNDD